jgi:hypothetical protein
MTDTAAGGEQEASNRKTPDERKEALARLISSQVAQGFRVESQSDFQAVLVKGKNTNHVLHLILTLITFGLWAIVWIAVAVFGGEKREILSVDEWGNPTIQRM